jgi:hypothetical protein
MPEEIIYPHGGLNTDANPGVMPQGDYSWALNIKQHELGQSGNIVNTEGNTKTSITLPAGDNEVIGYCEDKEDLAGIYFVYNSNSAHCILRYNSSDDTIDKILWEESVLNFSLSYRINNPGIVGSDENKLLFWTDNYNPPRKLNITRMYNYTNFTSTTTTSTTT